MNPTILIIDDDNRLNQLLKDFLKDFGYAVITDTHPARGLKKLKQAVPDLVILDIMLPDMDGFEVCRVIRKISNIPNERPDLRWTTSAELPTEIRGLFCHSPI